MENSYEKYFTVSHDSATLLYVGDAATHWEMAMFGVSEFRNP